MAANPIGALKVVIGSETDGLTQGLNEADSKLKGFGQSSKISMAAVAALGAAAAAAGAKLLSFAKDQAMLIDDQARLAKSLGGTINGLRAFKLAAEDMGIKGVDSSLNRMNRRLGAAEFGAGAAAITVKKLGLNLHALAGMDIQQRMAAIADAIKASGVSSEEAARHLQNLGFEQRGVSQLFIEGGDAIRAATDSLNKYGLAISDIETQRLQDVAAAFVRIGQIYDGIKTQLTIALAPALEKTAGIMEGLAQVVASATPYIAGLVNGFVELSDKIAIALAGVAAFYAPAVIAGIGAFTAAVGVGAVGAVKALTAAMMANPIGLIATALVAVGVAIYKFRDQINEVFGVDVVKVTKDAANWLINSFVSAYDDIKFIWSNFGNMLGAAVLGGVNLAIDGLNKLIQKSMDAVNAVAGLVNHIPGVNIGEIGRGAGISRIENPYADQMADALEAQDRKRAETMARDNFAGWGKSTGGSTKPPSGTNSSTGGNGFGGAGGGAAVDETDNSQLQNRLDNLRDFLATKSELEAKAAEERAQILDDSLAAGLISEQDHNRMLYDVASKFQDSIIALQDSKFREQMDNLDDLHELGMINDADYHQDKLDLIADQEEEKTEALMQAYQDRQDMLNDLLEDGDISKEDHNAMMEDMEAAHQDALNRIVAKGAKAREDVHQIESRNRQAVVSGMMNNLVQLMNSGNKEMFRIGKIAAIAQAVLKGREAIVSSYAAGARIGGPIVGAAFAATAAAATAAQIASVASTTFGGGGSASASGGGGGGGYSRPTDRISNDPQPEPEPEHTAVTINLEGESYSRKQVRDLIEQINDATADGAVLRLA